jgi:16S rRNA G527 N7-methylase RsmG
VPVRDIGARVQSRLLRFGVAATVEQIQQACLYFGLLAKWNKTVNLTSLQLDPPSDKAIDRLIVEPFLAAGLAATHLAAKPRRHTEVRPRDVSASAPARSSMSLPAGPSSHRAITLLDIGSGGGSPAIPLKIASTGIRLMMVESKARKSAFLREAVRQFGWADAGVLNARLEELLAKPDLHEAADLVSIRAVRADRRLWNTVSAFAKPGAMVLWFRSSGDRSQDPEFFPVFLLEAVEGLIPAAGSELAILRKPL